MSSVQNGDVEMFTLRRSARIAEKQRQKFVENISAFSNFVRAEPVLKVKTPRKRRNAVDKMNVDVQEKKKKRTTKKTKRIKKVVDKFANLENVKFNDIFPLIKKYALTENEKSEKDTILQTIIKERKSMNIDNRITELYVHKNKIVIYLFTQLSQVLTEYIFTLQVITNHVDDILSYKEIDDLDSIVMNQKLENICNDKQTAEHQMKHDLQEIENLNSMICRLMM